MRHHRHPGSGQGKTRTTPKGRQVDPAALATIQKLLGDRPRRRDLLIEFLHLIQDHSGYLPAASLVALAQEMRLPLAEVYEVATFYAHFDVVDENEAPPPEITIRVCDSVSCELAGAQALLAELASTAGSDVRVLRAPCMGRCDSAPVVAIGHQHIGRATTADVIAAAHLGPAKLQLPEYIGLEAYRDAGGYQSLAKCKAGELSPEDVIAALEHADLRGMGGAGFPTGRKWKIVRGYPGPRLLAINADEGEPGTFKDRHYLETDPHRFLEGMLIAAWVVEAKTSYIYLRDEYPAIHELLDRELQLLRETGLADHCEIELRRGAGAYICGEESAMIESIEGKRGLPRNRPPYVAEVGLFGRPTVENNVETLYWVRDIVEKGPKWFTDAGRHGRKGWRSFSVSGRVKEPGVKVAPAGITVKELIEEFCGGMQDGHQFKAYLPGGASGGILPASMGDEPLDFGTLEQYGCFIGSAAIVVFSEQDNMRDVALNLMRFFEDESCGQCTPCRVGTEKAVKLMSDGTWNVELLTELSRTMTDASICGLGQAAGNPINSVLKYFPEDLK